MGQPFPNAATASKVAGRERWATDVRLPGMLHARVVHPRIGVVLTPEAEAAAIAFRALRPLEECPSGQELVERGFAEDVRIASQLDVSDVVPRLTEGRFVAA